jgi:GDPmannose 4,6-dehydratase
MPNEDDSGEGDNSMKALITGITGQDGSYLAEFLLSRGYEVCGTVRLSSQDRCDRINHILHRIHLYPADLMDQLSLIQLIAKVRPEEIYNLACPSAFDSGWRQPVLTAEAGGLGVIRLLEAIRIVDPTIRFFQASASAMYGRPTEYPQTEKTPFNPVTPFGAAKLHGHNITAAYRDKYGLKACSGILFDHESPRRGRDRITRIITQAAAAVKLGLQEKLVVDTLALRRDWGYAGDYVRAFWMMLQHPTPDDYVIASGQLHDLEDFCRAAFAAAGLDWRDHVEIKAPADAAVEVVPLLGDASRARRRFLWEPEVSFEEMIALMVEAELERLSPKHRLDTAVNDRCSWQGSLS